MEEEKIIVSKEKSTLYPSYTLKEIIEDFVKVIDTIGGKKVSIELTAKTLGVSSSTKSFTRKLSSAKQYGLIDISKGAIELTEIAKKILYPTANDENQLMLQAFSSPPIYSKLIERYNNKALPNNIVLANILLEPEYGITKVVKDLVVEKFIANCNELNILKNGILDLNISSYSNSECSSNINENTICEPKFMEKGEYTVGYKKDDYQEMSIPLMGKKTAIKIFIPYDCDMKDYEFFKKYVEAVLPMYIEEIKNKNLV